MVLGHGVGKLLHHTFFSSTEDFHHPQHDHHTNFTSGSSLANLVSTKMEESESNEDKGPERGEPDPPKELDPAQVITDPKNKINEVFKNTDGEYLPPKPAEGEFVGLGNSFGAALDNFGKSTADDFYMPKYNWMHQNECEMSYKAVHPPCQGKCQELVNLAQEVYNKAEVAKKLTFDAVQGSRMGFIILKDLQNSIAAHTPEWKFEMQHHHEPEPEPKHPLPDENANELLPEPGAALNELTDLGSKFKKMPSIGGPIGGEEEEAPPQPEPEKKLDHSRIDRYTLPYNAGAPFSCADSVPGTGGGDKFATLNANTYNTQPHLPLPPIPGPTTTSAVGNTDLSFLSNIPHPDKFRFRMPLGRVPDMKDLIPDPEPKKIKKKEGDQSFLGYMKDFLEPIKSGQIKTSDIMKPINSSPLTKLNNVKNIFPM